MERKKTATNRKSELLVLVAKAKDLVPNHHKSKFLLFFKEEMNSGRCSDWLLDKKQQNSGTKTPLTATNQIMIVDCYVLLSMLLKVNTKGRGDRAITALAHAFGVNRATPKRLHKQYLESYLNLNKKKERHRKNIINSATKCQSVNTALHVYKKKGLREMKS